MATFTTNPTPVIAGQSFTLTWNTTGLSAAGSPYTLYLNNVSKSTEQFSGLSTSITFTVSAANSPSIGSYTVKVSNNSGSYNVTAITQLSVTCFVEGSEILCICDNNEEYVKVENLEENMIVKTYLHGPKKIVGISKRKYKNDKTHSQICKLSGYPGQTKDLFLTGGHSILVDELNEIQIEKSKPYGSLERIIENKKLLLSCINENVEKINDNEEYNIYHVVLENDDIMGQYGIYANGILTESMSIDLYNNLMQKLCVIEHIF